MPRNAPATPPQNRAPRPRRPRNLQTRVTNGFRCERCEGVLDYWVPRCPYCHTRHHIVQTGLSAPAVTEAESDPSITSVRFDVTPRFPSGTPALDWILGTGIPEGSCVLYGGPPSAGKTGLMLQVAHGVAINGGTVLYVGSPDEMNIAELAEFASTIGRAHERIRIRETRWVEDVIRALSVSAYNLVVVDSLQTFMTRDSEHDFGSDGQAIGVLRKLHDQAQHGREAIFAVNHFTKGGDFAGRGTLLHHATATVELVKHPAAADLRGLVSNKNRHGGIGREVLMRLDPEAGFVQVEDAEAAKLEKKWGRIAKLKP